VLKAVELFTELRILKVDLPHHAVEAGIRTFAKGETIPDPLTKAAVIAWCGCAWL
jgi:hypothetical protein